MKKIFLILFLTFSTLNTYSDDTRYIYMPSGEAFELLGLGKTYIEGYDWALSLRYITKESIDDEVKLREEVMRIWAEFQKNVEKENFDYALIDPSELVDKGFLSKNYKTQMFFFKKNEAGVWEEF